MSPRHPKLKHDAIREAVFEIRFQRQSDVVAEIFMGKVADHAAWRDFKQVRSPLNDFPEALRRNDPNLRYKTLIDLISADGIDAIGIGPNALVMSRRGNYQGWDGGFGAAARTIVERLFEVVPDVVVSRLGMRFVNALRSDLHGVNGCGDLQLKLMVADRDICDSFNLNFKANVGTEIESMNRFSTVDFALGNIPENTTAVLDIDVHTQDEYLTSVKQDVFDWLEKAHIEKNNRFFAVLGGEIVERLKS